jgi:hypothetical protein
MMEVGTIPRKRTSPEEIIYKLREAEILMGQELFSRLTTL